MKKQEKAEMNPIRYKMNRYAIPAFIALILLSFIFVAMIVVFAKAKWLCWIPAGMALGLSVALIVLNAIIVKKEEETEELKTKDQTLPKNQGKKRKRVYLFYKPQSQILRSVPFLHF